uniref:PPIase cyclophilin-type domain-containing protein n=1 Tax=Panagrolaimus sp. PS1159 TaxID=55785 RepID=A0AC35FQD8_9BILA
MNSTKEHPKCFFDIQVDLESPQRIICELFDDIVPKTCENFIKLCQGTNELGPTTDKIMTFRGCLIHRITNGRLIETGDFSHNDGSGGESIYGGFFEDENFDISHKPFTLTMINNGPNTNGSCFAFDVYGEYELEGKNVAFGRVLTGKYILQNIAKIRVDKDHKPSAVIVIVNSGIVPSAKENGELTASSSDNIFEKEGRHSSVEIINEVKKRRRLLGSNMPEFCERKNPLDRSSPDENKHGRRVRYDKRSLNDDEKNYRKQPYNERHNQDKNVRRPQHRGHGYDYEHHGHRRDYGHRRYMKEASPSKDKDHGPVRIKGRAAKNARFQPYSNIPTPLYWKEETNRKISMKEAETIIERAREKAKNEFNQMDNQKEKKKLYPIYLPGHDEERKKIQKKAKEDAETEKEKEQYFGYLNTGSSSSTPKIHSQEQSINSHQNFFSSGLFQSGSNQRGINSNNNIFFGSSAPPRTSSSSFSSLMSSTLRPKNNNVVNGIENIRIQSPFTPPSSQQHQQPIHRPQFAYPQPQQFFFLN